MPDVPRSHVPGIRWPALLDEEGAKLLAAQHTLQQTQWWTADRLRAHQRMQLCEVVRHAVRSVPHYRELLDGWDPDAELTWERFGEIPILERDTLIDEALAMASDAYPASHGETAELATSRTSGQPVRVNQSRINQLMWRAITLRDHLWHRRDLRGTLGAIRYTPPSDTEARSRRGARQLGWGAAVDLVYPPAPASVISINVALEHQVEWLLREDPHYLMVYPTVLGEVLGELSRRDARPKRLLQVRTTSEALGEDTRARCEHVLGVPLVDTYSAQEVGYIALQCPDRTHYHVQSESLLVEVLRDNGTACAPGEIGRVVVSTLHNFATPLLRYAIGDYAQVGEPCVCGRGLPVLERIVGRTRGMLTYPDGHRAWPVFTVACREAARYRQIQLEQKADLSLIVRIVPDGPFTAADRAAVAAALDRSLNHAFALSFEVLDALPRGPTGKLQELIGIDA